MPDYMFLLESRITPEQKAALARMPEIARAHDLNLYLAGGAVRDLISGMGIKDLDFVVEGQPQRLLRDLEKAGARVLHDSEKLRHIELVLPGGVEASVAAARDDVYDQPGARPETRWSTITDDLRRRDFSINAIAISLIPASRGLVLDPTNGLADLETNHEVRALSIHSFTNQPVRLLRILRYCARMSFKMEPRTEDWFQLALERKLHENIPGEAVGDEVRQLAHEDRAAAILKAWEAHNLMGAVHEQLARRRPDYDGFGGLARVRENMMAAGMRIASEEALAPTMFYLLRRLKSREQSFALNRMDLRKAETEAVHSLEASAGKVIKALRGPGRNLLPKGLKKRGKVAEARALYDYLNQVPPGLLMFIQAEYSQPKALSAIRTFINKWKPLRAELPAVELETLGLPRGPKFDQVLEDLFDLQLTGKGRNPQDRTKLLRKLAGIKPEPPKKEKKEEKKAKTAKEKKVPAEKEKAAPATAAPAPAGKGKAAPPAPPPPPPAKAPAKKPEPPKKAPPKAAKSSQPKKAAAGRAKKSKNRKNK